MRKRIQAGKVLKAFLLLLEWGEERGVIYKTFETPKEYTLRLESHVSSGVMTLPLVVDVLEESLFSSHLVGRERLAGYYKAIREIRQGAA
jgi:hypothetical protein